MLCSNSLSNEQSFETYNSILVEENLDLFGKMTEVVFDEGTHVLRAKIDMNSPNMLMRDPDSDSQTLTSSRETSLHGGNGGGYNGGPQVISESISEKINANADLNDKY